MVKFLRSDGTFIWVNLTQIKTVRPSDNGGTVVHIGEDKRFFVQGNCNAIASFVGKALASIYAGKGGDFDATPDAVQ